MAGESLFRELEIAAFRAGIPPRTKQSIEWFKKKLKSNSSNFLKLIGISDKSPYVISYLADLCK